jgi:1-acyl-sn-glycerol-3-phosphate acyltransferase
MSPAFYALAKLAVRIIFTVFWRFRFSGAANVPKAGPLILVCNHVSYFDPPALGAAAPRPVAYMAKHELFRIPILGPIISWLGAFPVDRTRGDVGAFKAALGVLKSGACLGIFPEGTRNTDGTVQPQLGAAMLASMSGATVVPAYVSGTNAIKKFSRITVTFGKPMRFEPGRKATREDMAKWTSELMERISELRETSSGH